MILLTRLGGPVFALNPDLVERADCTPDTVITLVDGKKYIVAESLPEVISLIRQFRAAVVADAQQLATQPDGGLLAHPTSSHPGGHPAGAHPGGSAAGTDSEQTNVVPLHRKER